MTPRNGTRYVEYKWLFIVLGGFLIGIITIGGTAFWKLFSDFKLDQVAAAASQNEIYMNQIKDLRDSIERERVLTDREILAERSALEAITERNRVLIEFTIREIGVMKNILIKDFGNGRP